MLAIKKAGPNSDGIPEDFPMEVMRDVQELPNGFDLLLLDQAEYEQYCGNLTA